MSYEGIAHNRVSKFLKRVSEEDRKRLKRLILSLEDPYKMPHVKIKGENGVYRARIGKYRMLYSIFDDEELVLILKVDNKRKSIPMSSI
jgi:mRNA-degrading endonuclease RelE of RelBE toxin-antitoxin system